jgi:2-keto-4-pentenoate hydratase
MPRSIRKGQSAALAKLADLLCHGALVLGSWVDFDAGRDWATQAGRVRIGAQAVHEFSGGHAMADPAYVVPAWLRHATRHGAVLAAGSVVTTGTWCGLLLAAPGDEVEVAFDGIGQASVRL